MTWLGWSLNLLYLVTPNWRVQKSSQTCSEFNWIIPSGGTWLLYLSFSYLTDSSSSSSSSSRKEPGHTFGHFTATELCSNLIAGLHSIPSLHFLQKDTRPSIHCLLKRVSAPQSPSVTYLYFTSYNRYLAVCVFVLISLWAYYLLLVER